MYLELHEQAHPDWNGNRFDDRAFAEKVWAELGDEQNALRAALAEALDVADMLLRTRDALTGAERGNSSSAVRIAELRAKFLETKR